MPATSTRLFASAAAIVFAWLGGCVFDLGPVQAPEDQGDPGGAGPGPSSSTGAAGGASGTAQSSASGGGAGPGGGAGVGGATAGSGGAGGTGGTPPLPGCADGEREGYLTATEVDVAACQGGFSVPDINLGPVPECVEAGNTSNNPTGQGCTAANLCALGFHLCQSGAEVGAKAKSQQCPTDTGADAFWLTAQSLNAAGNSCDDPTENNVVGCGDIGPQVGVGWNCGPLTHYLSEVQCGDSPRAGIPPWQCVNGGATEANTISKPDPAKGGVLCCRD